MCRPESIAVIIPCLNEARFIGPLVQQTRHFLPNVFVVNDGSTDGTAQEATTAGATLITHNSSRGKGASLRSAFDLATRQRFRWALTMDGDGQHAPADIPKFIHAAEGSPAAMFIGNRMADPLRMPWLRRQVNQWMSSAISSFSNRPIPDSQCGFRLVNLEAWNQLRFRSDHFEIESEMILRFAHAGYRIDFVPIETRYACENSKIRPLRDTLRWFRWWFSIRNELALTDHTPARPQLNPKPQDAPA
jgi:glycosyltransferase involved in cell wall biosynthesis